MTNQTPEQLARDQIDGMLEAAGWLIQDKNRINLNAGMGIAVREYQTDIGPADYLLFIEKTPVGVIEAKKAEEGVRLTTHEDQSRGYAESRLRYLNNDPLPFVYESTGELTRFTDYRDPKPRSRPVFHFHKPQTLKAWFDQPYTLRERINQITSLNPDGLRACQVVC